MYLCVALLCPTYRENLHANHTWRPSSRQTPCFQAPNAPPAWFDSHRPLQFSLSGVSLRCPRTRLSLSPSSHGLDAAATVSLIECVDRPTEACWSNAPRVFAD